MLRISLIVVALLALPLSAHSQQRPTIMVVGTAHFSNPNHDANNMVVDDVLAPVRQAEIADLVAVLAQFKPTRIAIEATPSQQAELNKRLQDYLHGSYRLTADERDQIGLRLAAQLQMPQIDAVDNKDGLPGLPLAYDFHARALAISKESLWTAYVDEGKRVAEEETVYLQKHSLVAWFVHANAPDRRSASNRLTYALLEFDDASSRPGANWLGSWHARNLAILENVARLARPSDRILVLIGADHSYLLDQFASESGQFEVVNVEDFLHRASQAQFRYEPEHAK